MNAREHPQTQAAHRAPGGSPLPPSANRRHKARGMNGMQSDERFLRF